jgi:N-acetylglucosamine malate deacetylase 1
MAEHRPPPRLLTVMAHPDDAELLVGGTLFHLKELGWELGIVTMTAGDCGSSTRRKDEITRIRLAEAEAAAEYLGASYTCAGLLDLEVFANEESVRRMVEIMRSFDPDVVLTHSPVDYMVDHEETSRLARSASFGLAVPLYDTRSVPPARVGQATPALYYADPVEGIGPFGERILPHFYVDITRQLESKREMLSRHVSQRDWLREHHRMDEYLDRMTEWAALQGEESGFAYAEGLRQHLGHGYPRHPVLQEVLGAASLVASGTHPLPGGLGGEAEPR